LNVTLALEEVWNKFLLSPLEFARYIDEYNSPHIRAYFDVGNVVLYGYPQDWIRTLGKRIVKLHIKDFSFKHQPGTDNSIAAWVPLGKATSIGQQCMRRFATLAIKVRQPWNWIRATHPI